MTIRIKGYEPDNSDPQKIAAEKQFFIDNLSLILAHEKDILANRQYFFCPLSFAWCSFLWVGGAGPFCLGHLLLGWTQNTLTDKCSDCGGKLLITSFGGSMLSGCNGYTGVCSTCKTTGGTSAPSALFRQRVRFAVGIRKQFPQEISYWETYEGFNFSWGGDGREPATKTRLVVKPAVEPVTLQVLVQELASGQIRQGQAPGAVAFFSGLEFEMRVKNGGRITAPLHEVKLPFPEANG